MRSQSHHIIDHLASGRSLTPLMALRLYGTLRLGARIYDLRKQGHVIRSYLVKIGGKHVSSYYLARKK